MAKRKRVSDVTDAGQLDADAITPKRQRLGRKKEKRKTAKASEKKGASNDKLKEAARLKPALKGAFKEQRLEASLASPIHIGPRLETPTKRKPIKGKLKRISHIRAPASSRLARADGSTKRGVTRSGAKVSRGHGSGGFESGNNDRKMEEIFVTTKTPFSWYLKVGLSAFIERGCGHVVYRSMGAGIPIAMTLALAVQDNLPGPVSIASYTGSEAVIDEIEAEDELIDRTYQTRLKSTIRIQLSLKDHSTSSKPMSPPDSGNGTAMNSTNA